MRHVTYQQEQKGLFTFYKEQEKQEEILRLKYKKKSKNKKNKSKSKKKVKSQAKPIQNVFVIAEDNEEDQESPNPKQPLKHFLKNIKHNTLADSKDIKNSQRTISHRVKTQPNEKLNKTQQNSMRNINKSKVLQQLSKKYNFVATKLSPIIITPPNQVSKDCQQNFFKQHQNEIIKNRDFHKQKQRLVQRLRSLEIKSKSNLISNKEIISVNDCNLKKRCESQNSNFFNQVVSHTNDHSNDKNAYKLLKDAIKLPSLRREIMHTEIISTDIIQPTQSQKKLIMAAKNMPYQRKELRMKHSNERRRQFYKLNLVAQLSQQKGQGPSMNLIDMSKQYKQQQISSQQWQQKRKIIKSKLGIEL